MMIPPPLPPDLSAKEGRSHLRTTLSLMYVQEGRSESLTLGSLLSLTDDDCDVYGENGCGKNGGVDVGSGGCVGRSLSSLLGTHLFLELTSECHRRQRINWLRSVSMCLRINQDTGLEEVGEEEGEGRDPFREAIAAILKYLDLTLTLAADEGWTGHHRHG